MTDHFHAAWAFRHFIVASINGELKGRFARSAIGGAWHILNPLAQSAIFALVLAEVLGAKLAGSTSKAAYPIYLMAGMAAWGLFSEIVNRCLSVFIEYGPTLKKIAFPRICLPIIVVGGALLNHVLLLGAILIVGIMLGHTPGSAWFVIPLGIALISLIALGLGLLLGVFNVFSRDVGQVMGVVMQIWFWLTPIVYTLDVVPEASRWLFDLNPIVPLIRLYQNAMLHNVAPAAASLVVPIVFALMLLAVAFTIFRRASSELVDAL